MDDLVNFLDDILVYSKYWADHLQVLRQLLLRLRDANLTARPTKSFIEFQRLECLVYEVSESRLEPQLEKLKAIDNALRPTNKRQVKSFWG